MFQELSAFISLIEAIKDGSIKSTVDDIHARLSAAEDAERRTAATLVSFEVERKKMADERLSFDQERSTNAGRSASLQAENVALAEKRDSLAQREQAVVVANDAHAKAVQDVEDHKRQLDTEHFQRTQDLEAQRALALDALDKARKAQADSEKIAAEFEAKTAALRAQLG